MEHFLRPDIRQGLFLHQKCLLLKPLEFDLVARQLLAQNRNRQNLAETNLPAVGRYQKPIPYMPARPLRIEAPQVSLYQK